MLGKKRLFLLKINFKINVPPVKNTNCNTRNTFFTSLYVYIIIYTYLGEFVETKRKKGKIEIKSECDTFWLTIRQCG